jgi:hypothetical protein
VRTTGATVANTIGILVALCCAASADCDLSRFDRTPPAAIQDSVDNQFAKFQWASDVDTVTGRPWVWHYILNNGNRGLGVLWEKANIRIPKVRPLSPGSAFCNHFLADSVAQNPDTDAPIVYGTNDQTQQAAIYVADKPPKVGDTESSISTTYDSPDGKRVNVDVQLRSAVTGKGLYFELFHSPDVIVGVSGFPQTLSSQQFERLTASVNSQDAAVFRGTFFDYTKKDPAEAFAGLFHKDQGPTSKTDFLFFSGGSKLGIEVPARAVQKVSADMVVLDKQFRPILATDVMLLAPAKD